MQAIADDAGTHAQTLYSHFANKYALSAAAAVESLRVALGNRKVDTISFWRKWVERRSKEALTDEGADAFSSLISDTLDKPRFALVNLAVSREYSEVLTENLAEDFGLNAQVDLFPKLVAQMLLAASEHHIFAWQCAQADYDLLAGELSGVDEVAAIVDLVCVKRGIERNK